MAAADVYIAIVFYLTAALMIAGALGMVFVRNMVRSAVFLVVTLGGVAILYVLLAADFLAVVQLLVYVGAITILVLFAIMMTPRQVDIPSSAPSAQKIASALTAIAVGVLSIGVLVSHRWNLRSTPMDEPTSERIGTLLLTSYALPFEIASVLLTVGMIGAIVIARED